MLYKDYQNTIMQQFEKLKLPIKKDIFKLRFLIHPFLLLTLSGCEIGSAIPQKNELNQVIKTEISIDKLEKSYDFIFQIAKEIHYYYTPKGEVYIYLMVEDKLTKSSKKIYISELAELNFFIDITKINGFDTAVENIEQGLEIAIKSNKLNQFVDQIKNKYPKRIKFFGLENTKFELTKTPKSVQEFSQDDPLLDRIRQNTLTIYKKKGIMSQEISFGTGSVNTIEDQTVIVTNNHVTNELKVGESGISFNGYFSGSNGFNNDLNVVQSTIADISVLVHRNFDLKNIKQKSIISPISSDVDTLPKTALDWKLEMSEIYRNGDTQQCSFFTQRNPFLNNLYLTANSHSSSTTDNTCMILPVAKNDIGPMEDYEINLHNQNKVFNVGESIALIVPPLSISEIQKQPIYKTFGVSGSPIIFRSKNKKGEEKILTGTIFSLHTFEMELDTDEDLENRRKQLVRSLMNNGTNQELANEISEEIVNKNLQLMFFVPHTQMLENNIREQIVQSQNTNDKLPIEKSSNQFINNFYLPEETYKGRDENENGYFNSITEYIKYKQELADKYISHSSNLNLELNNLNQTNSEISKIKNEMLNPSFSTFKKKLNTWAYYDFYFNLKLGINDKDQINDSYEMYMLVLKVYLNSTNLTTEQKNQYTKYALQTINKPDLENIKTTFNIITNDHYGRLATNFKYSHLFKIIQMVETTESNPDIVLIDNYLKDSDFTNAKVLIYKNLLKTGYSEKELTAIFKLF